MGNTLTQTLRLVVTGDASRAARELGKVSGSVKRMGAGLRTAGTMAIGALGPIAAGLAAVTKEAIDEEKEMALLSKAIQNNTKDTRAQVEATEEWITAQQNATGIADGELRPALAALVAVTKDTGKAQDLLSTAMDIAVAKGKPLLTIAEALAKAQNGNIGILSRYGIATRNAAGETLTFDQVMQNAAKTFGGAASTAATTTSGKFSILKAKFADMREEIGTQFIPIALKLGEGLSKAFDYLMEHKEDVKGFFRVVGKAAEVAWSIIKPIVTGLWKVIEAVVYINDKFGSKEQTKTQKILGKAHGSTWAQDNVSTAALTGRDRVKENKWVGQIDNAIRIKPATIKSVKDADAALTDLDAARKNIRQLRAVGVLSEGDAKTVLKTVDGLTKGIEKKFGDRLSEVEAKAAKTGKRLPTDIGRPLTRTKLAIPPITNGKQEGAKAGKEARNAAQAELSKELKLSIGASVNFGTGGAAPGFGGILNGMKAVNVARQQLGDRYQVGASGPDVFDCSGLVKYVYNRSGLPNFPTYTGNQWVLGRQVPKGSIRPGDQLFFRTEDPQYTDAFGWGHTGIYIGGGQYIHAANSRSGVIQSSLASTSYPWAARRHFAAAGADFIANQPTLILAAEAGRSEHVKITPAPKNGIGGDGVAFHFDLRGAVIAGIDDLAGYLGEALEMAGSASAVAAARG